MPIRVLSGVMKKGVTVIPVGFDPRFIRVYPRLISLCVPIYRCMI